MWQSSCRLQAAGPEAEALVAAANRYGQTAVHIAARKGSAGLLRSLVTAGGAASLATADCEGITAAEIARRHGNGGAMRVLAVASGVARREQQRHRGTVPTAQPTTTASSSRGLRAGWDAACSSARCQAQRRAAAVAAAAAAAAAAIECARCLFAPRTFHVDLIPARS